MTDASVRTHRAAAPERDAAVEGIGAKTMMEILRDLTPLPRAVCSRGYDQAVSYLCNELAFRVISVPESHQHNGWVIPPSWDVEEAKIERDGQIIYDGAATPWG